MVCGWFWFRSFSMGPRNFAGTLMAGLLFYFLIVPFLEAFCLYLYCHLIYLFLLISGFFFGLFIYEKTMGEEKDARIFVWDEFVGMWIACFPLILFLNLLGLGFFYLLFYSVFLISGNLHPDRLL